MDELIMSVFLSDFMIFIIICAILLMVTSWAFRMGEYSGYLLGWLIGIFCIVVYSAVVGGGSSPDINEPSEPVRLSLLSVMIASVFGLMLGFAASFFTRMNRPSVQRQAVTIASLTALLVISLYIFATTDDYTRKVIGIFELAFAIGVLSNYVISGGAPVRRYIPPVDAAGQPIAQSGVPRSADSVQNRFDRLRRRIERRE